MKKTRILAAAAVAAALALPAAAFQLDLGKVFDTVKRAGDLKEVDQKQEIDIGKSVASNLLGAAPLLADARVQKYVNAVGQWLAFHTERRDLPWRFGVLDSPHVNAFATPGGYVFVTRGLLKRVASEGELAGVLAHEIAHVLQKHHLKAIQKNAAVGLGADLASFVAQTKGRDVQVFERVASLGMEIYTRGLDRGDELEADRMGVVIAARAGYGPYGLPAMLQTLETMSPQTSEVALMFKTHPAPAERLATLDQVMNPALESYAGQPELQGRFKAVIGRAHLGALRR